MTISSQRFKFLDQETNVGTIDFTSLTDNSIYTAAVDTADSAIAAVKEGESILSDMQDSISSLMDMVANAKDTVLKKISDALNGAIDKILSMKLPSFISKILNSLKSLDLSGVKSFFKDLLKVGSMFLCNNLDFLKSFMLGYSLTENILSGLMIGLLLSWLDRYCKGFTQEEVFAASNKGKLGMLFSNDGITLTPDTVLGKFSNIYSDFVRSSSVYTPSVAYNTTDFLDYIKTGSIYSSVQNLRESEISSRDKKNYIAAIENEMRSYEPNTPEYSNLLEARGELIKLPLISAERIEKANAFSGLNDAMGSIALNVQDVDLSKVNIHVLSEQEKSLLEKLKDFKAIASESKDINTRDHESGSFGDFDFSTVVPPPSDDELTYLESLPGLEETHRYNGLHPTTEVFTEQTMPGSTKYKEQDKPTTVREQKESTNVAPVNPVKGNTYKPNANSDKENKFYVPKPVIPGSCYA